MTNNNDDLSPEEKIEQENFFLKSKLITRGRIMSENSSLDPEIENMFLKNIIAFEEAECKPVFEIIGVNPKDFPPADTLSKNELKAAFDKLVLLFNEHGISYGVNENVPVEVSYRFLTEDYLLSESQDTPPGFGWTIDGCSGDCPSCFQADYCETIHDTWSPEELNAERQKRKEEGLL